jgi:hypothetical protein
MLKKLRNQPHASKWEQEVEEEEEDFSGFIYTFFFRTLVYSIPFHPSTICPPLILTRSLRYYVFHRNSALDVYP